MSCRDASRPNNLGRIERIWNTISFLVCRVKLAQPWYGRNWTMPFSLRSSVPGTSVLISTLFFFLLSNIESEGNLHCESFPCSNSLRPRRWGSIRLSLRLRGGATTAVQQKPVLKTSSSVVQLHPDEQKPEIHRSQSVLLINEVRQQASFANSVCKQC